MFLRVVFWCLYKYNKIYIYIYLALWGRKALALVDFGGAEWTLENCVEAMTLLRLAQWSPGGWLSLGLFTTPFVVETKEILKGEVRISVQDFAGSPNPDLSSLLSEGPTKKKSCRDHSVLANQILWRRLWSSCGFVGTPFHPLVHHHSPNLWLESIPPFSPQKMGRLI